MRHRVKGKKLGRTKAHKLATMRALALAIIEHKEIKTTVAKAKEARRYIERLITYAKKDSVHARRLAYQFLNRHQAVKKLFDEIAPVYEGRNGGYTRVIRIGLREGDGAEMALLQLVGFEKMQAVAPEKAKKASRKRKTEKVDDSAKAEKAESRVEETIASETESTSAGNDAESPQQDEGSEGSVSETDTPTEEKKSDNE